MSLTLPLLAALGSGLAFTGLHMAFKSQASSQKSPLALPALMAHLCPLWAALLFLTHSHHLLQFNLSFQALAYPLLWATCTVATTTILVFLLARFSLTEVAAYKKSLLTFSALSADILFFATPFPPLKLAALALLLTGALILSHTRHHLPTRKEWQILALWCLILTLQITLYKKGQTLQPEVLSHTLLAQFFATFFYSLLWFFPAVNRQKMPTLKPTLLILSLAFLGVILEGFAYAGLPLALVIVVTILPATLFAAHDLWRKELDFTHKSISGLALIALGFVLLFAVS